MTFEITGKVGQHRAWTACRCTERMKGIPEILHTRITTDFKNLLFSFINQSRRASCAVQTCF